MDGKGHSDKVSDGNEVYVTESWWKDLPCDRVAKNLLDFACVLGVLWRIEFACVEIGYLAEGISKQHVEGAAWFLLTAYSKI